MSFYRNCLLTIAAIFGGTFNQLASALDSIAPQSFEARGVKIQYFVAGVGEPIVLIHGLHSSAQMNWALPGVIDALAKQYQVIALDLPGHGGSDKPDEESAYGKQLAEDIALLLDHLKIKQAHIVGYSLGGMVALKFVALHPDRAGSLTLGGMGWLREGSRLEDVWEKLPVKSGSRTPAVCVHSIGQLAVSEAALKAINTPVLVVIGEHDPVKRLYVAPLQAARKDWGVIEIKDGGHVTTIMKPKFAEEICRWIGSHSQK